jgi:hypothetical protein
MCVSRVVETLPYVCAVAELEDEAPRALQHSGGSNTSRDEIVHGPDGATFGVRENKIRSVGYS